MASNRVALIAFNRGRLSPLALARTDFTRTQFSAETQTNWMPRALGSMMLRPGLEYIGATRSNLPSVSIPFIFARDDTARIELTSGGMRVWADDELVTRPSVSTAITNGTFDTNVAGWSDQDAGSAVSSWAAGGYLSLVGDGSSAAKRRQQVTVADLNVRHALEITIARGPVLLRVGSTAGGDEYITETTLETGYHSLALTPAGDFYIDLFAYNQAASYVDSITVASSGVMVLPAPYATGDLPSLRWDQSGDVVFVACDGFRQRRIERRGDRSLSDSWSIVEYKSSDGPFMVQNVGPVTITPSATTGDVTLTASSAMFKSTQVGALFKLIHSGQLETANLSASDTYSDPIEITGVDGARVFAIQISGTWAGTLTLQYSVSEPGSWVDAPLGTFTANTAIAYDDTLDNQIYFYRIGFKAGDYSSGTAAVSLSNSSGTTTGIARITSFSSATVVSAGVITELGGTTPTADWAESYWSDYRGYPSSVALDGGRLWWAGKDHYWGSVSDAYDSFDDAFEGDAGPISRSIGSGPVDSIYWLMSCNRLLRGAGGSVAAVKSSSLDEPITPTNFNPKDFDSQGAANIAAVKVGTSAIYVDGGGQRLMEAGYDGSTLEYTPSDLTVHVPEIGEPSILRIAVQRRPETRVHCVRSDGTVGILILDRAEEIKCWVDFETTGEVVDVCVEPGDEEDKVTYTIKRTIGGSEVYYHERWCKESDCVGGGVNRQADSAVVYPSGSAPTAIITGLDHLEGEEVVCWAGGIDMGTFTVSGGQITLSVAVTGACAGLEYEARYKSAKLAFSDPALLMGKQFIRKLGVILRNTHPQGLEYGPDFETMDDLPLIEDGAEVDQDTVHTSYDKTPFEFPGNWDADGRLCLRATAPRPCTLLAALMELESN